MATATTRQSPTSLKPFITVVRPCSKTVGADETKLEVFERLFEKWKRKQEYKRKLEKRKQLQTSGGGGGLLPSTQTPSKSRESLEPFDFQSPPKVLEIKHITLLSRPKKTKSPNLPSIVHKATVASQARSG